MSETRTEGSSSGLSDGEVAELKERERIGRDRGARSYLEKIEGRGRFRLRVEERLVLHYLNPRQDESILDAGAGVGRHALAVARRARRVTCLDFSTEALKVLRERAEGAGLSNIETVAGDVCSLPEGLGTFEAIYCCEVLQHVPSEVERARAMKGFHDRLVRGGRCLVSGLIWNHRSRGPKDGFRGEGAARQFRFRFTPRELIELYRSVGFRDVQVHGVNLLPGIVARGLPSALTFLETWASHLTPLRGWSSALLAIGRR